MFVRLAAVIMFMHRRCLVARHMPLWATTSLYDVVLLASRTVLTPVQDLQPALICAPCSRVPACVCGHDWLADCRRRVHSCRAGSAWSTRSCK